MQANSPPARQLFRALSARHFPGTHRDAVSLWSETKYLDRCNLPDSLGDVDVRQVINYDKCQRTGAEDDQKHHCIQTAHHFVDLAEHIRIDRNRRNDVACQQLFRQFPVLLRTLRCMDINALVNRITSVIEISMFPVKYKRNYKYSFETEQPPSLFSFSPSSVRSVTVSPTRIPHFSRKLCTDNSLFLTRPWNILSLFLSAAGYTPALPRYPAE